MPNLQPGKLATVEFSLTDPPVAPPTVSAIVKKDSNGVRSIVSGTNPDVLDDTETYTPAGNDYAAFFTVPVDAEQDDIFLVRVVYTIGSRQYSLWLVAGQVDFHAEAADKLLRANVITEVGVGGQYEMVWYDESDGVTELLRKSALQPDGTPLTSATQILGGLN